MIKFLQFCFASQILYVDWGGLQSQPFSMSNGLRQGSVLFPKFYCIYSDKLNKKLNESGIGCYIKGVAMNNFSYADDLVLLCPCATALNELLLICSEFAERNYMTFNTIKMECMYIDSRESKILTPPKITFDKMVIH